MILPQPVLNSLWIGAKAMKLLMDFVLIGLLVSSASAQRKAIPMDIPTFASEEPARPDGTPEDQWADILDMELSEQWVQAGQAWEIVLEQNPDWQLGHFRAIATYLRAGQPDEASRVLNRTSPQDDRDERARTHFQGTILWLKRDDRNAWRTLMGLVKTKKPFTATYHVLARVAVAQNQMAEGVGWLRHVLEQLPREQRAEVSNHRIFSPLHQERSYRSMIMEMGAYALVPDEGEIELQSLPKHLQKSMEIKDFDKRELSNHPVRTAEDGGYYYQGLYLDGEINVKIVSKDELELDGASEEEKDQESEEL